MSLNLFKMVQYHNTAPFTVLKHLVQMSCHIFSEYKEKVTLDHVISEC